MSGIEAVGLLLGAYPLLMSALEHFRQGAELLEDWWRIKKEYKQCKNEIKVHELAFESNMERFLLPLIVDDDDVDALIAEPGGPAWKDPSLEETLKQRLPKSYDLFLDTISDIKSTMDGLKEELGVELPAFETVLPTDQRKPVKRSRNPFKRSLSKADANSVNQEGQDNGDLQKSLSYRNFQVQAQKVKFMFGRSNRTKLFDELTRYNTRLRDLLDTNDRTQSLRQAREDNRKAFIKKFVWKLWRHASNLHRLLEQAWCCQCKHLHRTFLLLRQDTTIEGIDFYMWVSYNSAPLSDDSPWRWKDMKAQHIESEIHNIDVVSQEPKDIKSPPSTMKLALQPALRQSDTPKASSRVKVSWTDTSTSTDASLVPQAQENIIITDLCSKMAISSPQINCLGLLKDENASYVLHQGPKQGEGMKTDDTVSLEQLLSRSSELRLDRRQRYTIAFTLASSHLQLYPSPWLNAQWTKKDVVFAKHHDHPHTINIERPYIQKNTLPLQGTPSSAYASNDRSLSTLGILLIELCFGTALEEHDLRKQYDSSTIQGASNPDLVAALDLAVALEWSRAVSGEAGDPYADAVHWCLRGQVGDANSDKWREELYFNVVKPLQFCYEQMYPKK